MTIKEIRKAKESLEFLKGFLSIMRMSEVKKTIIKNKIEDIEKVLYKGNKNDII